MTLFEKVMALYPSLTPQDFINGLVVLQNDSDGRGSQHSKSGTSDPYPRPTDEQLGAV